MNEWDNCIYIKNNNNKVKKCKENKFINEVRSRGLGAIMSRCSGSGSVNIKMFLNKAYRRLHSQCRSIHSQCRSIHSQCRSIHSQCRSIHSQCRSIHSQCRSIHSQCRSIHSQCRCHSITARRKQD
jgi:hypothetical protein